MDSRFIQTIVVEDINENVEPIFVSETGLTSHEARVINSVEEGAQVNKIEDIDINGSRVDIEGKTAKIKLKTINDNSIVGEGNLEIVKNFTQEEVFEMLKEAEIIKD